MASPTQSQSPIPILLMIRALGLGGTERQLAEAAMGLNGPRFKVHVGCFSAAGLRGSDLRAAGIPVLELPVTSFASAAVFRAAIALRKYVSLNGIQMVHTFDVPLNVFGVPAAHFAKVPVVLSSQRAHRELSGPVYRRLQRITDRWVDGIVVNCRAMERHLIQDEGVPPSLVHVCYNAIDTGRFHPRSRCRISGFEVADIIIGSVCELRPEKRLDNLLEAFSRLRPAERNLRLLIVGSGPSESSLRELSLQLGIGASCWFEPATRAVEDWLRSIDIFVLPTESEALSNSLMEAMACGCCPIATNVGGNPELVFPGATGWLFEPGDVDQLTSVLEAALADPELRIRFAHGATQHIRGNFDKVAMLGRMEAIYSGYFSPGLGPA